MERQCRFSYYSGMKRLFFLLLVISAFAHRSGGQAKSSWRPSRSLQEAYNFDAADMALQRMYELRSPDTSLIEIPQRYLDTPMTALAAVFNLRSRYEADSVFLYYRVHRYWEFMPEIAVKIHPDSNWVWGHCLYTLQTGNPALNGFIKRYGVYLTSYQNSPKYPRVMNNWLWLASNHPIYRW